MPSAESSFCVDEGECVAVLGPNGAGKTTTVEILEGYRTRDSGDVHGARHGPGPRRHELRQRIGIVLQECGVEPYLTVSEVLTMHAGYYRPPLASPMSSTSSGSTRRPRHASRRCRAGRSAASTSPSG